MAGEDIPRPTGISNVRDLILQAAASGVLPAGISGASSGGSVFQVPTGPPEPTVTYKPFDSGPMEGEFIPGISAPQTVMMPPTMSNQEIAAKLAMEHAKNPQAQVDFEEALARSGYGSLDELLYGASLAQQPWEEFLTQRVSSGLFGPEGSGGPTTTVTTNISNRGQAYNTVDREFEAGLGRGINPEELTDFKKTLNAFERENPYVTTSGRGFSKTTGGFDPSEMVNTYVRGQEDYAEAQTAMNFMGVLDRILKDPTNQPGPDLQERMDRAGY